MRYDSESLRAICSLKRRARGALEVAVRLATLTVAIALIAMMLQEHGFNLRVAKRIAKDRASEISPALASGG